MTDRSRTQAELHLLGDTANYKKDAAQPDRNCVIYKYYTIHMY